LRPLEDRSLPAGAVSRVSQADPAYPVDSAGGPSFFGADGVTAQQRSLSDDGRYLVFASLAGNVLPGQIHGNLSHNVFLRDNQTGVVTLLSHAAGDPLQSVGGAGPTISNDGRWIAFTSSAPNLIIGQKASGGTYLYDRINESLNLISHDYDDPLLNAGGGVPVINADGSVVAFLSAGTRLVDGFVSVPGSGLQLFVYSRDTDSVALVSHWHGSSTKASSVGSKYPQVSGDGRYITFQSPAFDLLQGYTGQAFNAYCYDRLTGNNLLVSHATGSATAAGNGNSYYPLISGDGSTISFTSKATNLVSGFSGTGTPTRNVFAYDRATGTTTLVTHKAGEPLTAQSGQLLDISQDGRFVAVRSTATELVTGFVDGNGDGVYGSDIFLYDRMAESMTLVSRSHSSATTSGNGGSSPAFSNVPASISADGRFVAFESFATDLVNGFVSGGSAFPHDVFVYDRQDGSVAVASHVPESAVVGGDGTSYQPVISGNGQTVAFRSGATNLQAGLNDANNFNDAYILDRPTGVVRLATPRAAPSATPNHHSGTVLTQDTWVFDSGLGQHISADGRYIVYVSRAGNIVPGQVDKGTTTDIFLHDRQAKTTMLVSRAAGTATTAANGESFNAIISGDGRYVLFRSTATDLVPGFVDGNGPAAADLYLFDRVTGAMTLVSHAAGAPTTGGNSNNGENPYFPYFNKLADISDDGRFVTYVSYSTDLVAGFVDGYLATRSDVFLYDRVSGANSLVSRSTASPVQGGFGEAYQTTISGNGEVIAFTSTAGDMVPGQIGNTRLVYVFERQTGVVALVSHAAGSSVTAASGGADAPSVSFDGRYIAFQSAGSSIVANGKDTNGLDDIYLYDRVTTENVLVSHRFDSLTTAGDKRSFFPLISADGRFVTYNGGASDLVAGFVDNNGISPDQSLGADVYLYDRLSGQNTLVSHSAKSATAGAFKGETEVRSISGDGRFVTFMSAAGDLIVDGVDTNSGGTNDYDFRGFDAFLYDRLTNANTLLSHVPWDLKRTGDWDSYWPEISRDGTAAMFISKADNLIAADFNNYEDVFVYSNLPAVQSVRIADGSAQRSVVRSLTVTFDQPVFFAGEPAAAFILTSPAGSVQLAAGSVSGNSVTLTFSGSLTQFGSLIDGKYTLRVLADQIANIGPLDGNNDGVGGDDFTFNFHRLFGDADGNGFVDALDFRAFRGALGSMAFAFDFDGDGDVDAADFVAFRGRFGVGI
jgi:Tol biopolymer transport system component